MQAAAAPASRWVGAWEYVQACAAVCTVPDAPLPAHPSPPSAHSPLSAGAWRAAGGGPAAASGCSRCAGPAQGGRQELCKAPLAAGAFASGRDEAPLRLQPGVASAWICFHYSATCNCRTACMCILLSSLVVSCRSSSCRRPRLPAHQPPHLPRPPPAAASACSARAAQQRRLCGQTAGLQ